MKICEQVAVLGGVKSRVQKRITELYHRLQKHDNFSGIQRVYRPVDDEGEQLPPESRAPVSDCWTIVSEFCETLVDSWDMVASLDTSNCSASADISVPTRVPEESELIVGNVPVSTLLFLEKQLQDVKAFIEKLPVRDESEAWLRGDGAELWVSRPKETTRTKKVPKTLVKYEATKEHPAQVDVYTEDIVVGHWETKLFSNAVTDGQRKLMIRRVNELLDSVKRSRERANQMEAKQVRIGDRLLDYVFRQYREDCGL